MNETPVRATAGRTARRLADHPWLRRLARAGFAASGLIHLMIGWIAGRVALGGGGEADQDGALATLRAAPAGSMLLWACVVGFLALALWQVLDALLGGGEVTDRARAAGRAVLYGALGVTTLPFAAGRGSSGGGEDSAGLTAALLQAPLGRVLVGLVGLAVVGAGVYHVYKGLSRRFLEDLRGARSEGLGRGVELTGTVGYAAKGVALTVMGGLFGLAAVEADPEESSGLDGALKMLAAQPLGTALLLSVAVGLALYGVYSIARARYADL
ncbi:hypothetical protein BJF81_01090 [Ornithinimicrobium sp. CNJ-824]|uniref:DUF1206 domain-containing protein n=1 Tax=Ornithinimicrobium sp. CNJ-824 TaxID=1904966 RepID=UPI00095BFA30|nr:DUF1206 domain-containing protein [Ornithinimicrobium sp. CNJ-824]OLT22447.1 hypothetical protein BJF81_01090 [Ornithinimicrobium sp. CNJ-824]